MNWVDTPSVGKSGFVQSRLMRGSTGLKLQTLAEVSRHGATFWVEFTRFAPGETRHLGNLQEFMTLDEAKAWAVAMVRLS